MGSAGKGSPGKTLGHGLPSVVGRYVLFQLPELAVIGFALIAAQHAGIVSTPWAWGLFAVWVLKEVVLFPFVRQAYEPSDPDVVGHLIGRLGVATTRLDPDGTVRLGPELWRARTTPDSSPVEIGGSVCVKSVEGLTLQVESASED